MQGLRLIALLLPVTLAGCLSFSSSEPSPPERTTVVVPQSGTVTTTPGCNTTPC
jgi:hypothetical protein